MKEILSELSYDPTKEMEEFDIKDAILRILGTLRPEEREVIEMNYGVGACLGKSYSLATIARYFHVSHGRISQIRSKALRKLKHPARAKLLRDFVEN